MAVHSYETVFVAEPEISAEDVDQLHVKIKQTIASHNGSMASEDRWGRRRLAYTIQGHREGFYSVITFTAEPAVVAALEHLYNVTDAVMRHLIIRQIKRSKKFAPRRAPSSGMSEGHRAHAGRSSGAPRGRSEGAPRSSPPAPEAAPVTSGPSAPESPPAEPAKTPEEGNPI